MEPEKAERRRKTNKKILMIASPIIALVVGISIGGASSGGDTEPAEVVTETAAAPEPETVEVLPDVCVDTIDFGEDIIATFGEAFSGIVPPALQAAWDHDEAGIAQATSDMDDFTAQLESDMDEYLDMQISCAAAAN